MLELPLAKHLIANFVDFNFKTNHKSDANYPSLKNSYTLLLKKVYFAKKHNAFFPFLLHGEHYQVTWINCIYV